MTRINPNHSDVFDSYARVMEEMGFVKNAAEEKESAELKKYKDSAYPRVDSNDISAIELLYGTKPVDSSIKYDSEEVGGIMMAAHPEPVIIAPSYDRMNGLVENEVERNRVSVNIALMNNTSNETQGPKMAADEMIMELIRVANDLDNQGYEGLRELADECLEELVKEAKEKKKSKLDPKAKVRNRGDVCVPASKAKDHQDHFELNTIGQGRNALARVHQYDKVPPWYNGSLKSLQELVSRKVHSKYPSIKSEKKKSSSIQPRMTKVAGVTIQFRPGEVDGVITDAITMMGGKYEYSRDGSKVHFSGKQFHEFLNYLKEAVEDEELFDDEDKVKIRNTLAHVMKQLPVA